MSDSSPSSHLFFTWLSRCLLGALWLVGSEILFWNDPVARPIWEWGLLFFAYVLIATILLDWIVRYKVRDLWGVMIVLGVYGLFNGILINPFTVFEDVPRTILSHALGGHWFIGLEMFGIFAMLFHHGRTWEYRRAWIWGACVVGFNWGTWVWYFPQFNADSYTPVTLDTMFIYLAVALIPVIILYAILRLRFFAQLTASPADIAKSFQLSIREYALLLIPLFGLMAWQLLNENYGDGLGVAVALLIVCTFWTAIWFRGDSQKNPIISDWMPPNPLRPIWFIAGLVLFTISTQIAIQTPLVLLPFDLNQLSLLTVVFGGIGAVWVPLVAGVLGYRAFTRQIQTLDYTT